MRISDWSSDVRSSDLLERSAITCNKNGVPGDPLPPTKTSGIRVGSPAGTTRGFGIAEFQQIGDMIADVLDALREKGEAGDPKVEARSEEHTSELQSLMRISYAVFCLKKNTYKPL